MDQDKKPTERIDKIPTEKLIFRVGQCIDYQSLYALEESLNASGLTIQTTSQNRMILCKLREGRPVSEKVVDDYIFIGNLNEANKEITERASEKICDFIRTNSGRPDKVQDISRVWRNGLRMYDAIHMVNEDQQKIADDISGGLICG